MGRMRRSPLRAALTCAPTNRRLIIGQSSGAKSQVKAWVHRSCDPTESKNCRKSSSCAPYTCVNNKLKEMNKLRWRKNSQNSIKSSKNRSVDSNSYAKSKSDSRKGTNDSKSLRWGRDKQLYLTRKSAIKNTLTKQWRKITNQSLCYQKSKSVMSKLNNATLRIVTLWIPKSINTTTNVTKMRISKPVCAKLASQRWKSRNESNRWILNTLLRRAPQSKKRKKRFKSAC